MIDAGHLAPPPPADPTPPAGRRHLLRNPVHFLSLGGGLGLIPWGPGTFGTLPGFMLAAGLRALAPVGNPFLPVVAWLPLLALGVWCAGRTARAVGVKDPGMIVIDEYLAFAGLLLVMPALTVNAVWAFLCFRLFDVVKPFPVGWADHHVAGGAGIVLDDLLAAVWAWCALAALSMLELPGGPRL